MILDFSQNGLYMVFEVTENGSVTLRHFSNNQTEHPRKNPKDPAVCGIVELHVGGENPNAHHGPKHSPTSRGTTLKYVTHRYYENEYGNKLEFDVADSTLAVTVHYQFYRGIAAVRAWSAVTNIGDAPLGLEYVTSFAYTGLEEGDLHPNEKINVFIPHNSWCTEVNWKKQTLSQLGMDMVNRFSFNRVNLQNTGFWSTKEYLPMGAVENTETNSTLLWQIESCGSWQWEISDEYANDAVLLYLRLSGPNDQENGWYKELIPGECFETVKACVCAGVDFNDTLAEMTKYRRVIFRNNAENAALPIIFNDYMHCLWGDPTEDKLLPLIDKAAQTGAEYYCIDAGWYANIVGTWWETVGEWMPGEGRFPHGIEYVLNYIRSKGMIPGLWLEFESIGIESPLAKQMPDECFIMRHGKRVIDRGRYVLDFRNEQARAHCTEAVRRVIEDWGVGYIKNDYNIEVGIGTEIDSDSYGDGLLEHNRAFHAWYDEIHEKYPHVIFENCGSGGMRMDYMMLEKQHLQSVSDQECYYITAHVAAPASTAVLPEQAAIWSYPTAEGDLNETAFNMVNAMMQRMHLSGGVTAWSKEQFDLVKEGVEVYKSIRGDIPTAIPFYPLGTIPAYDEQMLCTAYLCRDCIRVIVWRLDSQNDTLNIPIKQTFDTVKVLYPSNHQAQIAKTSDGIRVSLPLPRTAVLLELR